MESSDTAIEQSGPTSNTIVSESSSTSVASIRALKQTTVSAEKSIAIQEKVSHITAGGAIDGAGEAEQLVSKLEMMEFAQGGDNVSTLALENPAHQQELAICPSAASSSSSSLSTSSTVVKKSTSQQSSSSTVVAASAKSVSAEQKGVVAPETAQPAPPLQQSEVGQEQQKQKQDNLNNTLKEIISDIDSNIKEQENIAALKQQEMELLKKQQQLAQHIQQQQLLAQQLEVENKLQQQRLKVQQQQQQEQMDQERQQQQQQQREQLQMEQEQRYQQQQREQLQMEQEQRYQQQQREQQQMEYERRQQMQMQQQHQQQHQKQHQQHQQHQQVQSQGYQPQQTFSKYSTREEIQDERGLITRKTESFQSEESSSNVTKHIDLNKIFTPATDAEEIIPKNRKLYASSAFYSPALHPTVEDQVALARRISHSLSDISNQKSKGQSMYVNRKNRSVKWVHEGQGKSNEASALEQNNYEEDCKENTEYLNSGDRTALSECTSQKSSSLDKVPLKLLMNPRGQVLDFNSLRESLNIETGLLSPQQCAELVTALQTQKGKGAELFAKRRRKADKWVVDETNAGTQSPSGLPDYHQYQPKPPTSPSILPAYSDAGKHRVQLNLHQEQLLEKYAKPGLKVVKTPWEAALETGSASTAFVEEKNLSTSTPILSPSPAPILMPILKSHENQYGPTANDSMQNLGDYSPYQQTSPIPSVVPQRSNYNNSQRELAYKPSIPQGWRAPNVSLPKELYLPKEIPLESYAPPPILTVKSSPQGQSWEQPSARSFSSHPTDYNQYGSNYGSATAANTFPLSKPAPVTSFSSAPLLPKQQYWEPSRYQTVPQHTSQAVPQVNFNPSPLPYDKLAKFQDTEAQNSNNRNYSPTPRRLAPHGHGSKVRNISPTPFFKGTMAPSSCGYGRSSLSTSPHSPLQTFGNSYSPDPMMRTATPPRASANELLHGQNFNTAARGWHTPKPQTAVLPRRTSPTMTAGGSRVGTQPNGFNAGHLPYSDF